MQNFVRSGVAAGLVVISGAAYAADRRAPTTPAVIPPYNWTNFCIGAAAGDAIGHGEFIDNLAAGGLGSGQWDSFIGGGQIDYNYQAGIIVMGGEAMSGAFSGNSGTWPGNIGGRFPVDIGGELDDHRGWPHRYLLSDFAIRSG
jgi:hypothetical protein